MTEDKLIRAAQRKLWGCTAIDLKEGDYFWLDDEGGDLEPTTPGEDDAFQVEETGQKGIYFQMSHCGGSHMERIDFTARVLRAPEEFRRARAVLSANVADFNMARITPAQYNEARLRCDETEERLTSRAHWLQAAAELKLKKNKEDMDDAIWLTWVRRQIKYIAKHEAKLVGDSKTKSLVRSVYGELLGFARSE